MNKRETQETSRGERFLETVAFGSLLVFASVMPPLDGRARDGGAAHRSEGLPATEAGPGPDLSPEALSA